MTYELLESLTISEPAQDPLQKPVTLTRRRIDRMLVAAGAVVAIVLAVAGGLLTWGSSFADDYVGDELRAQNIFFPDADALREEGRDDLLGYAGEQVTSGGDAEAYASYINGHLAGIADGQTYADLGPVSRAANAAVADAVESGASDDEVADLQATADQISGQRDSLFRGETLRGLLLSTFAWSTIGNIAFIASVVAYVAAAVMLVLVVGGVFHLRGRHVR
jgi:hypothetical protein